MKTFCDIFLQESQKKSPDVEIKQKKIVRKDSFDKTLRANGVKILQIIPTNFGTEVQLAKRYDKKFLSEILKDFDYIQKGNNLFFT